MLAGALKLNIISVIIARIEGEKRAALPVFSSLFHTAPLFNLESDGEENGQVEEKYSTKTRLVDKK